MKRLTPEDLQALQATAEPGVVVDVRSREEYDAGHVEGAVHIPLADLPQRAGELPEGRTLVTYCNMFHPGSSRGEQAAADLSRMGFDAGVLEGGFPAWRIAQAPAAPQHDQQD